MLSGPAATESIKIEEKRTIQFVRCSHQRQVTQLFFSQNALEFQRALFEDMMGHAGITVKSPNGRGHLLPVIGGSTSV